MHFIIYFKCLPQICTKMNGFKIDISKIFWGGAHRAPSPDPSPRLSRASPSVRTSPSILGRFAPSTRASPSILGRFAPSIRASPSTFDWRSWFGPPPKVNSWIRQWVEASSCNMVDVNLQRQIVVNHDAEVTDVRSRLDGYPSDVEFTNRAVL